MHVHPRAERAIRRGHPWVFAESISHLRHDGRAGDLAVVFDRDNRFLAIGLYDPASPIRIRVLHHGSPERIDAGWFAARIRAADGRREPIRQQDTTAYRIVHGENDGLPGLIVDRYERSIVVKLYTTAWIRHLDDVLAALDTLGGNAPDRVVLRLGRSVQHDAAAAGLHDGQVLMGAELSGPVLFRENGLVLEADLVCGQKTGFFLDQRDNRARVEQYCAGRTVLNVFAYTGGFSLYAARGGAREVTSLDASAPALAAAVRNFEHNRSNVAVAAARHLTLAGDAFEVLARLRDTGDRFDVVILDPPSFAKAQAEVERAAASYSRIVRLGLDVLVDSGLLVAASCSSRIGADRFNEIVDATARSAGRSLDVVQQTGHPIDHPIGFAEGAYLKCIFAHSRVVQSRPLA